MNERKTAAAVGRLYILGTAAGVLSVILAGSAFRSPDPMGAIAAARGRVPAGALAILTMGLALAFVPILLYPILKKRSEASAIGYVVFRGALETVTYILIAACWVVLAGLGPQIVRAGAADGSGFRAAGEAVLRAAEAGRLMTVFTFSLGALILYGLFFRTRLIPRWLAAWGLAAIVLHLPAGFLDLFWGNGLSSGAPFWMHIPIFLQEMVMAAWMIAKGFAMPEESSTAAAGASA
ncbi:MAG TPA: DUF4386 domain-containing protein [Magnetospirillaceae bacterium]|nr:DUF4386 domain-containing protein [Magnetospirillaceae bacterium]